MRYVPYKYQKYAEDFVIENDEAGLFLDMGLGKSVITLTAIKKLAWDIEHVLVIAPKRPALDTWPEEIEKWDHLAGLDYSVAIGTPKERETAIAKKSFITIINVDNVVWLVNQFKKETWPYDCLVIDELSCFKSSKSQRFRALKKVRPYCKRVIGLTGTPMSNGYMDLWAECFLLDCGKALGKTLTGYRDLYFTPGRRNGMVIYDWILKKNAAEQILDRIKPLCISMKTEDYVDLPDRFDRKYYYKLSAAEEKRYIQMEKDLFLELDGSAIDAVNAAALNTKLCQICSGAIYDEDRKVIKLHDEKLEVLDSLLEQVDGNALIFYSFIHEKDRILERYKEAVDIKEPGAIKAWKEGKIKILLAHPASAGHGLNLQSGGCTSIWFGLPTSLELYQQAIKRLHRRGQTKPVNNYILMAKGTYEEYILEAILSPKKERQDAALEAIKARLRKIGGLV